MYFFIVNPNSRCGWGEKVWKKLKKLLEQKAVEYECYLTEKAGDASMLARSLTEGVREPRVIVVVGGDGTFNEVLDGLAFGGMITLGYIPAGSGNDLARSLKLPSNPVKGLKRILSPKHHQLLDYGVITFGKEAEHRRFAVSSGIGMDAAVCSNLLESPTRKRLNRVHLGKLSYIVIGIKQLILARPSKGCLILDGVKKVEFNHICFISVHIHPFEGGGFLFAPKADYKDGMLSVCVVSQKNKLKLIPILLSALLKEKKRKKGVRIYDCREASFHVENPMPVHADGEICGTWTDIQAECIERKIRMIV
ncbi:MAG: YegS/Rv2252/BmrU family lipid kinase [Lachnospiraceae bacterium]|nr:YegS/Rv2252/BmrU family lipid kinase [Lachnospiraceae bacterium]